MRVSRKVAGQIGILTVGVLGLLAIKANDNQLTKEYKEKIEQADSTRYNRLMEQTGGKGTYIWQSEYYKMKDSLRADTFYRAGYEAGQQNIRDSLKQVNVSALKKLVKK